VTSTTKHPVRRLVVTAATVLAAWTVGAAATLAYADDARPGAADAGDRLFPGLGNGGYDAASYVSGRDLTAFLRSWLYDETTPPMPGHPEWRTG
jgi:hypothetical protein